METLNMATKKPNPSADEDHVMKFKAQAQVRKWTLRGDCFVSYFQGRQ